LGSEFDWLAPPPAQIMVRTLTVVARALRLKRDLPAEGSPSWMREAASSRAMLAAELFFKIWLHYLSSR